MYAISNWEPVQFWSNMIELADVADKCSGSVLYSMELLQFSIRQSA